MDLSHLKVYKSCHKKLRIGKDFDDDFDFEYFGFKRIGKASLVTDEVIYHLRNKPHIYHEGNFIEVKEPKSA